jgi:hypothetical protein
MKAVFKLSERLTVEVEGENQRELFENIAKFQEVFNEEVPPGAKGLNTRFVVRTVDDNKFYEMRCQDTGQILSFGCHKKGNTLFPKRRDDQGNEVGKKGWHKYVPPAK